MSDDLLTEDEKRALAHEKLIRERRLSDIRVVVSTAEGRRWYWAQMAEAGVFRQSFAGNDATTNFNEGKRARGLVMLHDLLAAKPEAFLLMQREAASLEKSDERNAKENKS